MKVFILGGSKSGKSLLAQDISVNINKKPRYYVATMNPCDNEDKMRIKRHLKERDGLCFTTAEQPCDINKICENCDNAGVFLIDSLTALLGNEMFSGGYNENAQRKIVGDLERVFEQIQDLVLVSDILHTDAAVYDEQTEHFRKNLGELHKFCAKKCDIVLEVCSGNKIFHKGSEYENVIF